MHMRVRITIKNVLVVGQTQMTKKAMTSGGATIRDNRRIPIGVKMHVGQTQITKKAMGAKQSTTKLILTWPNPAGPHGYTRNPRAPLGSSECECEPNRLGISPSLAQTKLGLEVN